jgi:hypothetical protein
VSLVASKRHVLLAVAVAVALSAIYPAQALAAGNEVGANLAGLLRHYASELYGGVVAIASLFFLVHRRYSELAVFLLASVVVAWMVFAPDEIAKAAEGIGHQIFG